ncbi:MAG: GMC family oxidoreductase [Sorangiineae bacterium]|nr:GMC family oxidoreductase [Polyangiaceae bacterium]MEB2322088.1 GMC family oxidoreductase [Sorangiineae bacterium]
MSILAYADYERAREFDADVVVVGTGAGGAVVGAELAELGHEVLFIEEGGYHAPSTFNPYTTESVPRLYRDASATVMLGRPPIPYVEGRCVGGSTLINGGMTYRPPLRVLEHWEELGGPELGARGLEALFERVEANIHAAPQLEVSVGEDSKLMIAGAKKMGWRYSMNHRNQVACVGSNNCTLGCPTGAKQSTLVTYLPRAFAKGARCLTELRVERLLILRGRCVGVEGHAIDPRTRRARRRVRVRARAVVIACGAVQTPLLLERHGLGRPSRQLGQNLSCHPNAKVVAVYPFDVEGWKGVSQVAQIREFLDDGFLFAENFVAPGVLGAYLPFHGAEAWDMMRRYNQMVMSGVLVEDSGSGSVTRALFGLPYARYDITPLDHARVKRGVKLLAEMHFALGAEYVALPFTNHHLARSVDDLKRIDELETDPSTTELFTVHIMGTARMGRRDLDSVVDLNGELHDLPGCYVADASLFPTPIGVNPQVTIMALATRVASRLKLPARRAQPQRSRSPAASG